ncbi:MAG: DUF2760 domain-containing protein, partial [Bdellovibrionales bacterium]|nr:DUF2760 domain-containing protein [Bdellovibrionales bacterium]
FAGIGLVVLELLAVMSRGDIAGLFAGLQEGDATSTHSLAVIAIGLLLLIDGAARLLRTNAAPKAPEQPQVQQPPAAPKVVASPPDVPNGAEVVNLLSLFQEKGRLIDFLMEDIATYSDAQVAGAARVVHQGCSSVVKDYFRIVPVHQGTEGEAITVERQVSPRTFRLVGHVRGEPPFTGKVLHRGWRASEVKLPKLSAAEGADIIAPAEVEL